MRFILIRQTKNNPVDFLGINQERVRAPRYAWNDQTPFHPEAYYESFDLPGRRMNNSRGWEIYPEIMYDMSMYLKDNYRPIPWLITENGMGREQEELYKNEDGIVRDGLSPPIHLATSLPFIARS